MSDKSKMLFEHAKKFLPGGVTYAIRFFEPYPIYVEKAKGSRIWDVNGNEYIDFWMAHGAVVVGHNYEPIINAIKEQLEYGIHLGWSNEWEIKWAKAVCDWFDADMVRPTNSGTEANMYAIRLARAYTKRTKIGKFEGGWHGGYDALHKGVSYPYDKPASLGLTEEATKDTILLPFNDLDGVQKRINKSELAAIIVEPVMGVAGNIPAEKEFLKGLRELCDERGIILIFDEVITGFRFYKGAQHYYNVKPDITTTGKAVGGQYFPGAGAFCGRADIMELLDQTKRPRFWERVFHGGTYVGNTLTMRAGYTLIEELKNKHDIIYAYLDEIGVLMRKGLEDIFSRSSFKAYITGLGSLVGIHFTKEKPINGLAAERTKDSVLAEKMFRYMVDNRILYQSPTKPHLFLSYAHTKQDIEKFLLLTENFIKNQ
ncbi:MAG: aspartate aminotransferase family protein [Thermoprotei archaeon]